MPALYTAAVEAMEQAGWLDDQQREVLKPWGNLPIMNARGKQVGQIRSAYQLKTH